jgi:hypothetical protein
VNHRFPKVLSALGFLIGASAALFYARQGLTLSHYDAKAHLVVARRILDSLTPEYSQIGAVWLPLPHVLNLLPVQIDAFYRTGASAVAFSVLAFALSCYAIARIVLRATSSRAAATLGVALFALNPDVLYLQSTPMTEPLLFGLTLLAIALVYDWVEAVGRPKGRHYIEAEAVGRPGGRHYIGGASAVARLRAKAGWALVAACLTRYEAWFVTGAAIVLSAVALWRRGVPPQSVLKSTIHLALYPTVAIVAFFFHSWFTTGDWFVTGGFFVPDNIAHGRPYSAFVAVLYGVRLMAGTPFLTMAIAGAVFLLISSLSRPERSAALVVLSLIAFMVLPTYAFYQGHPFRMRYMVAPVVSVAVFVGLAVGVLRGPWRALAATFVIVWLAAKAQPLNAHAPMVQEAQWDRPFSAGRRAVTACLMRDYRGELILASMGSLAHYMQELSHEGIGIRNFVHEGNLPYWQEALESPRDRVSWILIEGRAEGGDLLAKRVRASSQFLTGFRTVCQGGGVTLYKAASEVSSDAISNR